MKRVALYVDGTVVRHLHVIRRNEVVHIVREKTHGPDVVTLGAQGNPVFEDIGLTMWCGQRAKLYYIGLNHITNLAPTCVSCIGETQK